MDCSKPATTGSEETPRLAVADLRRKDRYPDLEITAVIATPGYDGERAIQR